jgi:hypothetical protein
VFDDVKVRAVTIGGKSTSNGFKDFQYAKYRPKALDINLFSSLNN